jgi:PAS domain S-box-containing protein
MKSEPAEDGCRKAGNLIMFDPFYSLMTVFEESSFFLVIISGLLVTVSLVVYYYKRMYSRQLGEFEQKYRSETAELQNQLHSLTQVMENLGEPCIYKNSRGVYSWCNHELELLWGMPRSTIISSTVEELFPNQSDEIRKLEAQVINSGRTLIKERKLCDKEGELRSFEITLKQIPEGSGYGILIFFKDISYYREQLEILNDLYVSTREDLQKRSDYYADFLRSGLPPLNRIMEDSETLLNDPGNLENMRNKVVAIADSGHQIDSYIRNLSFLAFPDKTAALYEKKDQDDREIVSLEDWQNKLSDRLRSFSESRGFSSFVLLQGDIPETMNTRFVLLNELLERLIENAENFSSGGFYLLIRVHRIESGYFTMNISVRNYGPVIDALQREKIFKPFIRIIEKGEGPGLGLTVGRSLAEKMGGSLSCDPGCEDGARFLLSLPPVEGEGTVISGNRLGGHAAVKNQSIILIHKDNPVLQRMRVQLHRAGYSISTAHDTKTADQLLSKNLSSMVLIDDEKSPGIEDSILSDWEKGLYPSIQKVILMSSLSTPVHPLDWSLLLDLLIEPKISSPG